MTRLLPAVAAFLATLCLAEAAQAQTPPTGLWKFRIREDAETITFLFNFSQNEGKWVGDFIASSAKLSREPQFASVEVSGDNLKFTLTFGGREFLAFDGVIARDGKKITGSVSQFGGPLRLTELHPSRLKKLDDPVELAREDLSQMEAGPELFDLGFAVLSQAAGKKLTPEEVRGITDRLAKGSATYGPRWERTIAVRLATTLADQQGFADIALAQARRAERMLTDESPIPVQMEVTETLARVLAKAGKADEAKKYAATAQKLEAKDYAEYSKSGLGFTPEPFAGRKGKSDRAVVVEAFTGAECVPCAAIDLACQALLRAFQPRDVIVLEYHLPVSGPDPLMSPDGLERFEAYSLKSAPVVLVNGKSAVRGGGPAAAAKERFVELRGQVEQQLETPAPVKITLTVSPAEKGYSAKATVADLEAPGDKLSLRFVLVEDRIRYAGQSGVRYHANVVRAFPGGVKGFPLTKKTHEQSVSIDLAEVRGKITKFLDEFARTEGGASPDRPLALANLKLIALVQNDATGEILQAVQVEVK